MPDASSLPCSAEERQEDLRLLEATMGAAEAGGGGGEGAKPRMLVPKAVDADDEDDEDDDSDESDDDDEVRQGMHGDEMGLVSVGL